MQDDFVAEAPASRPLEIELSVLEVGQILLAERLSNLAQYLRARLRLLNLFFRFLGRPYAEAKPVARYCEDIITAYSVSLIGYAVSGYGDERFVLYLAAV